MIRAALFGLLLLLPVTALAGWSADPFRATLLDHNLQRQLDWPATNVVVGESTVFLGPYEQMGGVANLGVGGLRIAELTPYLDGVAAHQPKSIAVGIGLNDAAEINRQYKLATPRQRAAILAQRFAPLVAKLKALGEAGTAVALFGLPPATTAAQAEMNNWTNTWVKQQVVGAGNIAWVGMDVLRDPLTGLLAPQYSIAPTSSHLTRAAYRALEPMQRMAWFDRFASNEPSQPLSLLASAAAERSAPMAIPEPPMGFLFGAGLTLVFLIWTFARKPA